MNQDNEIIDQCEPQRRPYQAPELRRLDGNQTKGKATASPFEVFASSPSGPS